MEGGKIKKTRKLRRKFKKGQFRSGPETKNRYHKKDDIFL